MYPNKAEHYNKRTPFSITGIVEWIGDEQTLGAKGFRKREIVISDDPRKEYPDYTLFEFNKDKCDLLRSVRKGDEVTVGFFTEARWWEPKDHSKPGRWFGSLNGVSLKISGADAQGIDLPYKHGSGSPSEVPADAEQTVKDDLPF